MKVSQMFAVFGLVGALCLSTSTLSAQDNPPKPPTGNPPQGGSGRSGRGNFDPAQMQQRMLDGIKERLGFSDADWSAVQPLAQKVLDAWRDTLAGGTSMFRIGRRPSGGDTNRPGGDRGDRGNRPSFFGSPSPEAEALQKAIDDKSPAGQVKAALDKYRASKKEKEAKLAAAQEDFRKILSATQEAHATLLGLLP
jgi:hypothetical protein